MTRPLPRQKVPALEVPLVAGGTWSLDACSIETFLMVVFYRHKNCGVCQSYLKQLAAKYDALQKLGVEAIAISIDGADGAKAMAKQLSDPPFAIGHSLSLQAAQNWGLYLSTSRKDTEPAIFSEPGLFLVDRCRQLYFASVQSMPFGRTSFESLLEWIPKVVIGSIPARGEHEKGAI